MITTFFLNIYFTCLILYNGCLYQNVQFIWYEYVNGIYWKARKYKIEGFHTKKCLY